MQQVLCQLFLVVGSWEGTLTKCLGITQNVCQWQVQGECVPRGVAATAYVLGCMHFFWPTPEVTEATGGAHSQTPSGGKPCLPLASEMTAPV